MVKSYTLLLASAALALAADFIPAVKINKDLMSAKSADIAKSAKFQEVVLYPQTTIENNDEQATYNFKNATARKALVGVVTTDKAMSVVVKFKMAKPSKQEFNPASFPDGVAVQFPQTCQNANELPYIGMGSEGRPVTIFLQKNNDALYPVKRPIDMTLAAQSVNEFGKDYKNYVQKEDSYAKKYQKVFVGEGFRSMTEVKDSKTKMDLTLNKDEYTAVFTRTLNDGLVQNCDALPMAVATWVGSDKSRDGMKWLSSWTPVELKNSQKAKEDIAKINEQVKGDTKKGEELAKQMCQSCHTMGQNAAAAPYMAPNLSNIGGYATASYLRESILKPSAVVVPGYNANAHPIRWYTVDEKGKRESTMPPFEGALSNEQLADITAYLQTLKASKPK